MAEASLIRRIFRFPVSQRQLTHPTSPSFANLPVSSPQILNFRISFARSSSPDDVFCRLSETIFFLSILAP